MIERLEIKLRNTLESNYITVVIIFLTVTARIIQLIFFFNIYEDHAFQVSAMKNFINGHGISLSYVTANNLSTTIYEPLIKWPPGYTLLLSPFYIFFNHNYIITGLAVDILFAITLIFITRKILFLLDIPLFLVNIFTLITSFFVYFFYFFASTDAITITILLIAIYQTLLLIKTNRQWVKRMLFISLSLFACGFLKYLFIPIIFIIPLFLIVKGFADQNINLKKTGIFSFVLLVISIGVMLAYQKFISGTVGYISAPGRGYFPENLVGAYPFIPASFIKPDTFGLFFSQPQKATEWVYKIFQWLHLISLPIISIFVIIKLVKGRFRNISAIDSFFYIAFFLSLSITVLLGYLSFTVAKEDWDFGVFWTYIEEPRYYGLPNVLIHLSIFLCFHYYRAKPNRKLKIVLVFFIACLLPEAFRGIVFDLNRLTRFGKEEYSWQYEDRFQKYADSIINQAKEKYATRDVVVSGSPNYLNRVFLYSGATLLDDPQKINNLATLNTKEAVLLLVSIHEKDFSHFQPFLSVKGNDVAGKFDDFYFYTVYVQPH